MLAPSHKLTYKTQVMALVVPQQLGVTLPSGGFREKHNFTLASRAEGALVAPQALQAAPSVGHFHDTRVWYQPAGRNLLLEGELSVLLRACMYVYESISSCVHVLVYVWICVSTCLRLCLSQYLYFSVSNFLSICVPVCAVCVL